ncbi:MAG TPA: amidohydrolase family protein [Candidatus Hydrogenedentes bacterium]|nr:amidohydrolase family protein [Candidatus Hydrogenedentota bacterium]HOL76239.1 amidohydrolase family protein [Candidatus Hydrogenedentota bacterium]HPO86778.1 amidohydrolase family protein [Candidatus Hydrogenedentota bacterium]
MVSQELRARLQQTVDSIAVIDTHEHIPPESAVCDGKYDLFRFLEHYVSSDLVSAGMSRETLETIRNPQSSLTLEERWRLMEPFWKYCRTTGYGRAILEYMHDLFGVEDISGDTYAELSRRIQAAHTPGWYQKVLREFARIELALVITWPGQPVTVDRSLFRAVPILDHFAIMGTRAELAALEKETNRSIQTLDQLLAAQEGRLDDFCKQGIVAVKIFLAYRRPLHFERVDKSTAARVFDRIWLSQTQDLTFADLKPLQDFMTRRLVGLAAERGLPIQIHTGLQEGNGNYIEYARPTLLTNLFMEFQDARFVLFHAGYPYVSETAVLAKTFPNVFADLCWMHAVSPFVAARTLEEWLETIPCNKILGFGGDSNYVEGAYGHCKVARRVTTDVLARKVEEGYFSEEEAVFFAKRLLRENAKELFRV